MRQVIGVGKYESYSAILIEQEKSQSERLILLRNLAIKQMDTLSGINSFCDYNEYEIACEYEDAGKSGKSIEGRIAFNQMMDDIKSGRVVGVNSHIMI